MAISKKSKDNFAQRMYLEVTESGANVLTFARVNVGISIFDYAVFVLHRVEYDVPRAVLCAIVASTDECQLAICGSNSIAAITMEYPQVYDNLRLKPFVSGTPASGAVIATPFIHDFTGLPGGGLIVPAQDLFYAIDCDGLTGPFEVSVSIYYTVQAVQAADYLELAQSYRVIST